MFNGLFSIIGISISILYPLLQTYKLLAIGGNHIAFTSPTAFLTSTINAASGVEISNKEASQKRNELLYQWLTYWIVLSTLLKLQSFGAVSFLINMLPFSSLITLYLQIWLVFPIVQHDNDAKKVTGSYIIYNLYMVPYIYLLDEYIKRFNFKEAVRSSLKFYNAKVDGTMLPKIPLTYLYLSSAELEKESNPQGYNKSILEFTKEAWSRFYVSSPSTNKSGQSQSNAVTPEGSSTSYIPKTLLKSIVSPILTFVNQESKSDNDYTMIGTEDIPEDGLNVTKVRSSFTKVSDILSDNSTNDFTDSRRSSASRRKPSWGFGTKSRTNSINE